MGYGTPCVKQCDSIQIQEESALLVCVCLKHDRKKAMKMAMAEHFNRL